MWNKLKKFIDNNLCQMADSLLTYWHKRNRITKGLTFMPKVGITVRLTVTESDGTISYDKTEPAHSFTRNFWNALFSYIANSTSSGSNNFGSGYISIKSSAGTLSYATLDTISFSSYESGRGILGILSNSTYGIVVGTSAAAFTVEQFALGAQCVQGTGTNNLQHAAQAYPTISWTVGTLTWLAVHRRIFNNNSAGAIGVNETGLYSDLLNFSKGSGEFMVERNVLGGTVTVGIGAQLTVTYNISVVFPW